MADIRETHIGWALHKKELLVSYYFYCVILVKATYFLSELLFISPNQNNNSRIAYATKSILKIYTCILRIRGEFVGVK